MPGVGGRNVMLRGLTEPDVMAYYDLLLDSAILMNARIFNPNLFNEMKQLIDFQIAIVNVSIVFMSKQMTL